MQARSVRMRRCMRVHSGRFRAVLRDREIRQSIHNFRRTFISFNIDRRTCNSLEFASTGKIYRFAS